MVGHMANTDAAVSVNRFRPNRTTWIALGVVVAVVLAAIVAFVLMRDSGQTVATEAGPPAIVSNDLPLPPEKYGFELNDQQQGYIEYHATDLASEDPFNILSFYQSEMGERGWVALEQDGTDDGVATLRYQKEAIFVRIDILAEQPGSHDFNVRFTVCPPSPEKNC